MIGFSVWWAVAPDPLLNIPISVYLHDPGLILKLFRDTFVNHICSVHPDVVTHALAVNLLRIWSERLLMSIYLMIRSGEIAVELRY
jgi:hypothetical protein